jgi:PhoH-like ATPase
MPLPPAPTKRAALLAPEAYDAPARTSARASRKPQADDEGARGDGNAQILATAERMPGSGTAAEHPAAFQPKFRTETARRPEQPSAPSYKKSSAAVPQADVKPRKTKATGPSKLFVLDTNVLLHDPMCLFRFEEHDLFLPMIVLEELDGHKKGMTEVARNARQTSRSLDALAGTQGADFGNGLKLDATGHREAGGKLFFQTQTLDYSLPISLPQGKADNQILGVVEALRKQYAPREVVLVSKDINMRVKARALGLPTDDYQNDKTLDDSDLLYSGSLALPLDFWAKHGKTMES